MKRLRVPPHDIMPRTLERGSHLVQHSRDRRMRLDHTVVGKHAYDKWSGLHLYETPRSPVQGTAIRILGPWRAAEDGSCGSNEGLDIPGHGPDDGRHMLLALCRYCDALVGETGALCRSQSHHITSVVGDEVPIGRFGREQGELPEGRIRRLTLGFRPYRPSMWLGMRMLPPMSVPHPTTDPCRARRVPSPPVEPPGVKPGLAGWTVKPQSGFSVSHHCANGELNVTTGCQ